MYKVSMIIPYFNRADSIIRALDSVVNQDFKDAFEIILVNDGSTDNSAEIVDEYILSHGEISFKHICQKNGGPSKARNTGIGHAKGEYIAFLDSDDSWEKDKLKIQIDFMDANRDVMITGTNYKIVSSGDKAINKYDIMPKTVEANFHRMLFKFFFFLSTVVIRREVFYKDRMLFIPEKRYAEDHLLFIQIVRRYRGVRLSIPLACIYKFEYGQGGLSSNLKELVVNEFDNFGILYKENKSNKKKISFILYLFTLVFAYVKHIKRMLMSRVVRRYDFLPGGMLKG